MAKRQATIQSRNRVADGNGLRRAFTPKPGDAFIVTERMVVERIIEGEVWVKHFKADGIDNYFCIPLTQWRQRIRNTMKRGVIFQPV
jgi:hypothetical protein